MNKKEFHKYLNQYDDINFFLYPFPTGRIYIFGNDVSLKLVLFGHHIDHEDVAEMFAEADTENSKEIKKGVEFLDNYLLGRKGVMPKCDLSLFTEKETAIYKTLMKVPFGKTISYKELSGNAGLNNAARFAGNTMAKNLFPIFIPCHRVVKSDGNTGFFSGGVKTKEFLLMHESIFVKIK